MAEKRDESTRQPALSEAETLRAAARGHLTALKEFWGTFAISGVILLAAVAVLIRAGLGWFVSNKQVMENMGTISAGYGEKFVLATVGSREQGVYDPLFGLSGNLKTEVIGGTTYYLASVNSSLRVDSGKNLNNFLSNADLRPGSRGSFDLYVICRTAQREVTLNPVFSAWSGEPGSLQDAFAVGEGTGELNAAAEFLKGHILLFAQMDEKGMYSGNIDYTRPIQVSLSAGTAAQGETAFPWGEEVYSDGQTAVCRLTVYWVWPELFGNFIYTGNSYNKNLFSSETVEDFSRFVSAMESDTDYKKFFCVAEGTERPKLDTILSSADYRTATAHYRLYSDWYNAADEQIGDFISYIELGFEVLQE